MNAARDKAVAEALAQIDRVFPIKPKLDIFEAAKRYQGRSEYQVAEDKLNADHIRIESHSSRFI